MSDRTEALYDLVLAIRGAFNDLRAVSDTIHAGSDITTAMRALLEHLCSAGPGTVPAIARAKNVSRQHIQLLADALVARGLAEFAANPGHARSPVLAATHSGAERFGAMRARERESLDALAAAIGDADFASATRTIQAMRKGLAGLAALNDTGPRS
jgi:DNA-binding MarR family transcriptional regulator